MPRPTLASVLLAACAACAACADSPESSDTNVADSADIADIGNIADSETHEPPGEPTLGLNDVTLLVPLDTPPLAAPADLVPLALFERVVTAPGDMLVEFDDLRVVAVRFDLCDRIAPGECPEDADGRMRIVLQPMFDGGAFDVALHAFFPIPHAELADLVALLRELASLHAAAPVDARMAVSPALVADPDGAYFEALQSLVARYGVAARIDRLTFFAQFTFHAALNWVFRGVERDALGELVDIDVPDIGKVQQEVLLVGDPGYQVTPLGAAPEGLALALDENAFAAAQPSDQMHALEGLAAVENPLVHTPTTVQCVACHVSTTLLEARTTDQRIDPDSIAGRYTSTTFDLRPLGDLDIRSRTLRVFGWIGQEPIVGARVVHETAEVIGEIDARFPPE